VATLQANQVQTIYTFNKRDFEVFQELTVSLRARSMPDVLTRFQEVDHHLGDSSDLPDPAVLAADLSAANRGSGEPAE